jgi:cell division protein FtsL
MKQGRRWPGAADDTDARMPRGKSKEDVVQLNDSFEYAIRKDVRNNPIVREVDEERHRELWQSVGIGVVLVLVLLFSAWQHFELLRHGYKLEQMQRERASEAVINRHLRLEIETLSAAQRIEKLATQQLGMVKPGADDAVILERVSPSPVPTASVVAAR